jgi:predicted DNA-binding transcriptional regulator YafY
MNDGRRASADERARRINTAAGLLDDGEAVADVVRELAGRFRLSERQARRYVDQARRGGPVAVPEEAVVFTVRLPAGLVGRLRRHASDTGRTLSSLVAEAIDQLLGRLGSGRGDG